jgi:hypothetical protein
MPTRHLLPIGIAGTVAMLGIAGGVSVAGAQRAVPPPRATLLPVPRAPADQQVQAKPTLPANPTLPTKPADPPPITFFVATAPAGTCGPGCDAWIAADGKIDLDAAQRLRKVLAKLGRRKLPLILHSAGGSVLGAIELGRLVHSRSMEVTVARTVPAGCPYEQQSDKTCETLKRSGRDLVSELDSSRGMCNSACVLVLAGGVVRSVPPWVRLGVHAIGFDLTKTPLRGAALAAATRSANARIVEYLHDMGVPKALFDASNAVPHESPRFLQRDELVRFGLDTRTFGESAWRFTDKPSLAVAKGFFVRTGDSGLAYPEALLRLSCNAGKGMRLTFARERAAPATGTALRPVRVTVNGTPIDLPYTGQAQAGKIELRTTALWPDAIATAGDDAAVEISGFDRTVADGRLPDRATSDGQAQAPVALNMAGFSAAYAKLRKACDEPASTGNACGAEMSPRCMPEGFQNLHAVPSAAAGPAALPAR